MRSIALVLVLVLVLVAACGGGDGGSSGDATAQQFCVSETNRYRQMNGKSALTESASLEDYADTGAPTDYDATTAHSHFTAPVGMCIAAFYAEGPGSDYSTHGHYINMMGNYATLGCGIYSADNGDVTIVQDYGN